MKRILVSIMAAFLVCAIAVSGAYAMGSCRGWGKGDMQKKWQCMVKELNLTPEQREKIEANRKDQGEKAKALHEALKEKRDALKKELNRAGATRASAAALVAEVKALEAKAVDQKVEGIFAVKEILTPEQFEKFSRKMEKKMGHHKGFGGCKCCPGEGKCR